MLDFNAITEGIKNFLSFISTEALLKELERRGVTTQTQTTALTQPTTTSLTAPQYRYGFNSIVQMHSFMKQHFIVFKDGSELSEYISNEKIRDHFTKEQILSALSKEELKDAAEMHFFVFEERTKLFSGVKTQSQLMMYMTKRTQKNS